jgi:CRISPR-associated protein Csd2
MSKSNDAVPIYLDPTKRHEFVLLFDVKDGNPNGNPDAGNLPRIDPETGHGIVTDVSVKRKVRDYVDRELQKPIFIQSEYALNSLIVKAAREKNISPPSTIVEDEELLSWLGANLVEGLELDGKEALFVSDFNSRTFAKELQEKYKMQSKGLEEKLKELAKTLKLNGSCESDDQILFEILDGRDFLDIDGSHIALKKGTDPGRFDEKQLTDIPKIMLLKIRAFVSAMTKGAKTKLEKSDRELVRQQMIDTYFDIRMFGAVLSTGINAGQVRGPMQIKFGRSIDRVVPLDHSITRCAITKSEDFLRKETEMARKPNIAYGLYRVHGYYNPSLARRKPEIKGQKDKREWECYVSKDDLEYLWEAIEYMFEKHSASSATAGEQATRGLWVFSHDNPKGNAHAYKLFELIKVPPCGEGSEPRDFEDYADRMSYPGKDGQVNIGEPHLLQPLGFPGVSVTRLV